MLDFALQALKHQKDCTIEEVRAAIQTIFSDEMAPGRLLLCTLDVVDIAFFLRQSGKQGEEEYSVIQVFDDGTSIDDFTIEHNQIVPEKDIPKQMIHALKEEAMPKEDCPRCKGTGEYDVDPAHSGSGSTLGCPDCGGVGKVTPRIEYVG